MSRPPAPPSAAERLLRLALRDPEWLESVAGDLEEEFRRVSQRLGPRRARRWYWHQTVAVVCRVSVGRLLPGSAARRPWRAPMPDDDATSRWAWLRDVRYALRALAARPALSGAIVLTLGLALAANATIFNLADALYLRPFRFAGVDRLVVVASAPERDPLADRSSVAPADFIDWTRQSTTLTDLVAADFWDPNLSETGEPEQLAGHRVSPRFFEVIGATPQLGRTFLPDEATTGRDKRVVLSNGLWARRFGSDPAIVGRSIRLNGEPHEVVGVMRPGPSIPYGAEVWAPLAYTDTEWRERTRGFLLVIGRLSGTHGLDTARAEMRSIVERQRREHPETNARREVSVVTLTHGLSDAGAGPFLMIWQGAALLLLLIACANIANLLLARGTERQQEFAVRLALGAGRWRLALQVLVEGAWLAVVAVVVAVPLAAVGVYGLRRALPPGMLRWVAGHEFLQVDFPVIAITGLMGLLATLGFSVLPALHASRAVVGDALRQSGRTLTTGRSRRWLGTTLAAGQVALTLTLVVGSTLILGAVDSAVNGILGFDKAHVMTARLTLSDRPYATPEARRQFVDGVLDRLSGMPAVQSLGAAAFLPYGGFSNSRTIHPEGTTLTPAEVRFADFQRITPGFLTTMRVAIVEGRDVSDADREDSRAVAVVSRSFADRYWPGQAALGRRFRTTEEGPWIEVVGVSGDIVHDWFMQQRRPTFYRPMRQEPPFSMAFVARTNGDPLQLAGEMRRAVAAVDPDQPILELRTMEQVVDDKVSGLTYLARALAVMGAIALVLALTGVYSLVAYLAARRTQEFGVRMALGATRWEVMQLTIRQALVITSLGLGMGSGLAWGLGRLMASSLFGLVSLEAWPLAVMAGLIGVTALAAGYLPARRAANLDPSEALRIS